MARPQLRFKVGDRVLAKYDEGWEEAFITKLWSREERGLASYRMRTVRGSENIYTDIDSNDSVRAYTETGLPRVIQEIQCGSSWEDVESLLDSYSIDVDVVGSSLLLHAATAGNEDVVTDLIETYGVSEATCDKDGRNILHIALLHKHFELVEAIRDDYEDLFLKADNKGLNVIHYLEWAKRMKQPEMVKILEKYINELRIHHKFGLVTSTATEKVSRLEGALESKDQEIMKELLAVSVLIDEWGLYKSELIKLHDLQVQLTLLGTTCCKKGFLQSLMYVLEFLAPLRLLDPEIYTEKWDLMVRAAIYGPQQNAFPNYSDARRMESCPGRWARELNYVYIDWSPVDTPFLEFIQHSLQHFSARSRRADNWDDMVVAYMGKTIFAAVTGGVLVAERCEILQNLLSHQLGAESGVSLSIHLFVVQGQLHLLQWAVRAGHIDLKSPVSACASLVEHVHTLSWLTLETKRKNKAR
eukprot:gene25022-28287_t